MNRMLRLIPVLLLFAVSAGARQDPAVCGTHREKWKEQVYLHRQAERARLKLILGTLDARPAAAAPAAARDIGDIAILEDSDGIVASLNSFNLGRRTVTFLPATPSAQRYRFETGDASYDPAVAAAGTALEGIRDDDWRALDLPFSFPFFGTSYQRIYINSDGNLTFTAPDAATSHRSLGRVTAGPPRIAVLFRDLDPFKSSQGIRVLSEGSRFVVSWVGVPEYQDFGVGAAQTFQVRLFPDGRIQLAYADVTTDEAVVGISPGRLLGSSAVVSFIGGSGDEYSSTIAERFTSVSEIDIITAAQKFFSTHEDAYDYLVIFNNQGIPAASGAVAYEVTVRNNRTGYGDPPVDDGGMTGSAGRLQSIMNMGPLDQYPTDPNAVVRARALSRDTPLTILGHEAGHLFLAFVSVKDPNNPSALPMLGRQSAHWNFAFNSEASFLEGNRIKDNGPGTSPRFQTIATVEGYAPLDQYLMGFRAPEEVPPTFLVTSTSIPTASRAPQPGVYFDGDRRDVTVGELIQVEGRRTPDYTVAQRNFRFAFILVVAKGTEPPQADLDKLGTYRRMFGAFYQRAASDRAAAEATLRRSLKLSLWPAAGVVEGASLTAKVAVEQPLAAPLTVSLKTPNGAAEAPATVTIPAGASSVTFAVRGARAGVEEFAAEPADNSYETVRARLQVLPAAELKVSVASGDKQTATPGVPLPNPVVIRVTDVNNLPYPGVKVQASVSAGGSVDPQVAVADNTGLASFKWTPGSNPLNELQVGVAGAAALTVTALAKPVIADKGVVNAASFAPGIAPGSFVTIFGANLAGGSTATVRVLIGGRLVRPFYASERQINFLVPADIPAGVAEVSVSTPLGLSAPLQVLVSAVSPGIFFNTATGLGAVLFPAAGGVMEVYATGLGPLRTGSSGLLETTLPVEAFVTGKPATVLFSGQAPGFPGLNQVDVRIPDGVSGEQKISLRVSGQSSNEVKVQMR